MDDRRVDVSGATRAGYPLIGPLLAFFVRANLRKDLRDLDRYVG
jgi:hypothetical protein